MSKSAETIAKELARPFPAEDIEWRVQRSGLKDGKPWAMVLAYVTARAIQERLDEVCGLFGWCNVYKQGPDGGVLCGISIYTGEVNKNGQDVGWLTKWDGAENTNIEAVKGGISGAFKRAGSVWGIGRYLYNLEEGRAVFSDSGRYSSKVGDKWFKWNPPALPAWALPEGAPVQEEPGPSITCDELMEKITDAKAIPHLANLWTKYAPDMAKMSEQERKDLAIMKDSKKLALKAAQDAGKGEG